jgi:predicted GIY-YIG superfamily endonuclease
VKAFVYYLLHPTTSEIRYVGITKDVIDRFASHLSEAGKSYKCHWIMSLLKQGLAPRFQLVCVVQTYDEAKRIEIALISLWRRRGARLTNSTAGGDGALGMRHDLPARQKMSLARKGKKHSDEHVRKISEANKGVRKTISARVLAAHERMRGAPLSPEICAKVTASLLGRRHSAETKRKMSAWQSGIKRGPLSAETREHMRQAGLKRWARERGSSL